MKKEHISEEAKQRAANYMSLKGALEPKDVEYYAFILGAKWQAERMYSEEDMIKFAEYVATYPDKNRNVNGEMLHAKSKYDGAERTIDLLKQFKKK
jgi:gamma-glutamylcyclotransferase (GGCT)/AIG2-like uncharacterized protein YtfP